LQGIEYVVGLTANLPALVNLDALQQQIYAKQKQTVARFREILSQIGRLQGKVGDM